MLLAFLAASAAGQVSTGRGQIWTASIAQLLHEPPGWSTIERHETRAVAFSPDDKRLAVTVAHASDTHLFILDSAFPEANVDQFDIADNCGVDLRWNPRGDALLVCGTLLRLTDRATCNAADPLPLSGRSILSREFGPHRAWWFDSDHVVRQTGVLLDLHCERTGRWQAEPGWQIIDTVPSKDWLLLRSIEGAPQRPTCRYSINDRQSHRTLLVWPSGNPPWGGDVKLVAGAQMLCLTFEDKLRCRTVNGGRDVAMPGKLRKYTLDQTSGSSARVIAQRWAPYRDPWWTWLLLPLLFLGDDPGGPAHLDHEAILDLHTGRVLSTWKPKMQDSTSPHIEDRLFHYALSGSGELLAESGDGIVELFNIQ